MRLLASNLKSVNPFQVVPSKRTSTPVSSYVEEGEVDDGLDHYYDEVNISSKDNSADVANPKHNTVAETTVVVCKDAAADGVDITVVRKDVAADVRKDVVADDEDVTVARKDIAADDEDMAVTDPKDDAPKDNAVVAPEEDARVADDPKEYTSAPEDAATAPKDCEEVAAANQESNKDPANKEEGTTVTDEDNNAQDPITVKPTSVCEHEDADADDGSMQTMLAADPIEIREMFFKYGNWASKVSSAIYIYYVTVN